MDAVARFRSADVNPVLVASHAGTIIFSQSCFATFPASL
jgi:hypothetical protein